MSRIRKWFSPESLRELGQQFVALYRRFPLTMLCSLLATAFLILYVRTESSRYRYYGTGEISIAEAEQMLWWYMQYFLTFLLGVPLLFSAEILSENISGLYKKIAVKAAAVGVLVLFYFSNPITQVEDQTFLIRFFVLFLAFHLFVAFAPFWNSPHSNGFWQYNKTLFLRILTAFLYSGTLSVGLSLAILAVEKLFGFNFPERIYLYLFIVINGYVNTAFFLAGIPRQMSALEQSSEYPKGLKVFTQFVVLPLVVIYLVILYAYEAKILVAWDLPKGWVSNLVLLSAVAGIFAFLLLYPLKQTTVWVKHFNRGYYVALLPLIGLLFVAIYVRINAYGVTEPRYFVAALAVWLLGIVLYFLFSRTDNIKIIPISLFFLCLLSVIGPCGAFSVSDSNQLSRLRAVLEKNKWLENGKVKIPENSTDAKEIDKVEAGFAYFSDRKSYAELQPFFSQSLSDSLRYRRAYDRRYLLSEWSGLSKVRPVGSGHYSRYVYSNAPQRGVLNISGYDYLQTGYYTSSGPVGQDLASDTTKLFFSWQDATQQLIVHLNDKTLPIPFAAKLQEISKLSTNVGLPPERLQMEADNEQLKMKLIIRNLAVDLRQNHLQSMDYTVMIKEK